MEYVKIKDINKYISASVNPMRLPDIKFEVYSVPSYETDHPEYLYGREIASNKICVQKNDILLCKINPRINRVWVVKGESEYQKIASSEWIVVRTEEYNPEFLAWYFKSPKFKKMMVSEVTGIGGSLTRAQPKFVAEYPVPVISEKEQNEIVRILSTLDKVIDLRKKELEQLENLVRGRFVELFGDVKQNPFGWNISSIGEVISLCEAGWSGNGTQRKKNDGEVAVLKVSAVTKGYFIPEECKVLDDQNTIKKYVFPEAGDLLFSRANTREMVGATAVITQDYPEYILPDKLWKVRFIDTVNVWYMKYILSSESVRSIFSSVSTGTSGSMYNVSMEKFKTIVIPLPPLELQQQFADFVKQVNKSKVAVQKALDEAQLLFDSLMQEYFG